MKKFSENNLAVKAFLLETDYANTIPLTKVEKDEEANDQ
jgi:hypothetical protein